MQENTDVQTLQRNLILALIRSLNAAYWLSFYGQTDELKFFAEEVLSLYHSWIDKQKVNCPMEYGYLTRS